MSSRIEIELTSKRSESEWTWRAAGAKQPKGVLEGSLLHDGAKVGDVLRAEADFEIDGITITVVYPPQAKRQDAANQIKVVGPSRDFKPVTSQLAPKREGRKPRRRDDKDGRDGRDDRRDRKDRQGDAKTRGARPAGRSRPERGERPERPGRPAQPTYKKLAPKDDHRRAVLDELSAEQRPIAEQVLRGGIPAVRQAIDAENEKARSEGRPELNSGALIALAEELLPKLKAADWQDRAQAAKAQIDEISVRDLRAVVTGADAVARTDEARLLAAELREALERRTVEARESWIKEIGTCLEESRVIRALRLSARPPDAHTKFPPELLEKLKTQTEEAMSPDTAPDRWVTLLDAVSNSPVRRSVEPKGLPENPGEELLTAAKQAAGRIPALAKQLGVTMPPPPIRKPPKPAPSSAGAPIPPPPSESKAE